ncbi:MAG: FHA domain-containing protein [Deltaproteobacteria bacterium]|nr:FHA domain-containing protein [Deltaproteobacteria bacterium]
MARFRLRFLQQEFDLVGPEIRIGRSPDCDITIDDPLVSRQHARIEIRNGVAYIIDTGSLNGVRINGRLVKGEQMLKDGDRIRLGSQELVFTMVSRSGRAAWPTGFMRICHACGATYAEGMTSCPACEAPALNSDEMVAEKTSSVRLGGEREMASSPVGGAVVDTVSGLRVESWSTWSYRLFDEIDKAFDNGQVHHAERLLRRIAKEIDERFARGERIDASIVSRAGRAAVVIASQTGSSDWLAWCLSLHRRQSMVPSERIIEMLEQLDQASFPDLAVLVEGFVQWRRARAVAGEPMRGGEVQRLLRLEQLATGLSRAKS